MQLSEVLKMGSSPPTPASGVSVSACLGQITREGEWHELIQNSRAEWTLVCAASVSLFKVKLLVCLFGEAFGFISGDRTTLGRGDCST